MKETIVSMQGISKSFSGVHALDNACFELQSYEVLALLGENGAGKSTLMKILSGIHTKDAGKIEIFGNEYESITPKQAQKLGIAIIHQELNMCSHLSVAENIFLGRELVNKGILKKKQMEEQAKQVLDELNIDISPKEKVGNLPVSKRQLVEIAKAVSTKAKILIMDEPTSTLSEKETEDLFKLIHRLKAQGCGIVYISHRLAKLEHIVDRVTIMRDGKYILTKNWDEITIDEIIKHMVGREIKDKFPRVEVSKGKKIFEVKNLNCGRLVSDVNFELFSGEIVGFAGLMGAGRTETTRAIFGIDKKSSGEILLDGNEIEIKKPMDAIKAGIVLAPEDRHKDGLCLGLSIRENITLPNLDLVIGKSRLVSTKKENALCRDTVEKLKIKANNIESNVENLSGGNQQKIVVGKWLAGNAKVVIFDEPTRGIDVACKVEIYNLMNELKKQGAAVMFTSSEMPEILGIADRIIVMCEGKITGELIAKEATQNEILELATKFSDRD